MSSDLVLLMMKTEIRSSGMKTRDDYRKLINVRIESIVRSLPQDLTIISGENEVIQTNKYLLSRDSGDSRDSRE